MHREHTFSCSALNYISRMYLVKWVWVKQKNYRKAQRWSVKMGKAQTEPYAKEESKVLENALLKS